MHQERVLDLLTGLEVPLFRVGAGLLRAGAVASIVKSAGSACIQGSPSTWTARGTAERTRSAAQRAPSDWMKQRFPQRLQTSLNPRCDDRRIRLCAAGKLQNGAEEAGSLLEQRLGGDSCGFAAKEGRY